MSEIRNDITMYPAGVIVAVSQPTWFVFVVFVMWVAIAVYVVLTSGGCSEGR